MCRGEPMRVCAGESESALPGDCGRIGRIEQSDGECACPLVPCGGERRQRWSSIAADSSAATSFCLSALVFPEPLSAMQADAPAQPQLAQGQQSAQQQQPQAGPSPAPPAPAAAASPSSGGTGSDEQQQPPPPAVLTSGAGPLPSVPEEPRCVCTLANRLAGSRARAATLGMPRAAGVRESRPNATATGLGEAAAGQRRALRAL